MSSPGNLWIKTSDAFLTVELKNFDESVFAVAEVPENFETSVEKCVDSSRGYALKLTHQDGRFVWVGLVFHDRNSAFDFFACFEEQLKRKKMAQNVKEIKLDPTLDFTHKKGAKIKINLKKDDEDQRHDDEFYRGGNAQAEQIANQPVAAGPPLKQPVAPANQFGLPGPSLGLKPAPQISQQQPVQNQFGQQKSWGNNFGFGGLQPAPQPISQFQQPPATPEDDFLMDFLPPKAQQPVVAAPLQPAKPSPGQLDEDFLSF